MRQGVVKRPALPMRRKAGIDVIGGQRETRSLNEKLLAAQLFDGVAGPILGVHMQGLAGRQHIAPGDQFRHKGIDEGQIGRMFHCLRSVLGGQFARCGQRWCRLPQIGKTLAKIDPGNPKAESRKAGQGGRIG